MNPRVSVGIPVYNGQQFLSQAVDSVLQQDFDDFEIVICDNASTDSTASICKQYAVKDPRVRYIRSDLNIGAAPNFNRVFSLAKGSLFKWLSCDDVCCPGFLRRCVELMDAAPESVVLVYPQCEIIDQGGRLCGRMEEHIESRAQPPYQRLRQTLLRHGSALALCGLIRSSALRRTRLRGSFVMDDCALLAELAMLGEIWEIADVLLQVRVHPGNALTHHSEIGSLMEWLDPRNKWKRFHVPPRIRLLVEFIRSAHYLQLRPLDRILCLGMIVPAYGGRELRNVVGRQKRRLLELCRALLGN